MKRSRKAISLFLAALMVFAFVPTALAANTQQASAAEKLHALDLLAGVGKNENGSIDYGLGAVLTREAAVTLIVNILGKYDEAMARKWNIPFNDVSSWAEPFIGYAYANGITTGKSNTTFGSKDAITTKQYLTFVLNGLGYTPGIDFEYDTAWIKSDALGFTNGRYNAYTTTFKRGDAIAVTYDALSAIAKTTQKPLYDQLITAGVFTKDQARSAGLPIPPDLPPSKFKVVQDIRAGQKIVQFGDYSWIVLNEEDGKALLLAENIIDVRAYNEKLNPMTWELSSLRKYLNSDFYNSFSATDKNLILSTHVVNKANALYSIPGGNATDDRIFLLSEEEADFYFPHFDDRVASFSSHSLEIFKKAIENASNYDEILYTLSVSENSWWWYLRTPGKTNDTAIDIRRDGSISSEGIAVNTASGGIRPALYINISE